MNLGKVGLALGGVILVGAVSVLTLGMPLQMDTSMPMGPFVIQAPTELFSLDSDNVLVVAPEVIDQPESKLVTLPEVQAVVDAVDETESANDAAALDTGGASAVEAAAASQAAGVPYAGCSGGH